MAKSGFESLLHLQISALVVPTLPEIFHFQGEGRLSILMGEGLYELERMSPNAVDTNGMEIRVALYIRKKKQGDPWVE